MLQLREVVFREWEAKVRATVKGAGHLAHPILINTFPALYDNIAEALSPSYPRTSAGIVTPSMGMEHGGERARLRCYEPNGVIHEYQILRSTIFAVLKQHNVCLSEDEMQIIGSAIDTSIRDSVTAFTLVQAAFREQFVATLAHDLRTPLGAASMGVELLRHTRDPDKIDGIAEKIAGNLSRIDQMVQDMLDTVVFRHGERLSLDLSPFDIADAVKEVCEQSAVVYGPRFEMVGTSITGWWGRDAIKRALENMVSNAAKYGAPDTPIRIAFREYGGRIILSVHNQGDPIPPDQIETIFQVFRRAKAAKEGNQQGWGIGLPYVRSVAESHGGSIDVDSAAGRGTTISIDMPTDSRPYQNAPTLA
jgi:signal transduction histidine kinase